MSDLGFGIWDLGFRISILVGHPSGNTRALLSTKSEIRNRKSEIIRRRFTHGPYNRRTET